MTDPLVCCILLKKDRPAMARRAVECFRAQTYSRKQLIVLDTGCSQDAHDYMRDGQRENERIVWNSRYAGSIGALRNLGAEAATGDILIHWDSDDWSHPNRIAEQVALLQASGADCVGYNEMLFWDSRPGQFCGAWRYSNPNPREALGTSLCYWRKTWERNPFPDTSQGEDFRWLAKVGKVHAVSSFVPVLCDQLPGGTLKQNVPRMIASIHGANTSNAYDPVKMRAASEWHRVPEWDEHCRKVMVI